MHSFLIAALFGLPLAAAIVVSSVDALHDTGLKKRQTAQTQTVETITFAVQAYTRDFLSGNVVVKTTTWSAISTPTELATITGWQPEGTPTGVPAVTNGATTTVTLGIRDQTCQRAWFTGTTSTGLTPILTDVATTETTGSWAYTISNLPSGFCDEGTTAGPSATSGVNKYNLGSWLNFACGAYIIPGGCGAQALTFTLQVQVAPSVSTAMLISRNTAAAFGFLYAATSTTGGTITLVEQVECCVNQALGHFYGGFFRTVYASSEFKITPIITTITGSTMTILPATLTTPANLCPQYYSCQPSTQSWGTWSMPSGTTVQIAPAVPGPLTSSTTAATAGTGPLDKAVCNIGITSSTTDSAGSEIVTSTTLAADFTATSIYPSSSGVPSWDYTISKLPSGFCDNTASVTGVSNLGAWLNYACGPYINPITCQANALTFNYNPSPSSGSQSSSLSAWLASSTIPGSPAEWIEDFGIQAACCVDQALGHFYSNFFNPTIASSMAALATGTIFKSTLTTKANLCPQFALCPSTLYSWTGASMPTGITVQSAPATPGPWPSTTAAAPTTTGPLDAAVCDRVYITTTVTTNGITTTESTFQSLDVETNVPNPTSGWDYAINLLPSGFCENTASPAGVDNLGAWLNYACGPYVYPIACQSKMLAFHLDASLPTGTRSSEAMVWETANPVAYSYYSQESPDCCVNQALGHFYANYFDAAIAASEFTLSPPLTTRAGFCPQDLRCPTTLQSWPGFTIPSGTNVQTAPATPGTWTTPTVDTAKPAPATQGEDPASIMSVTCTTDTGWASPSQTNEGVIFTLSNLPSTFCNNDFPTVSSWLSQICGGERLGPATFSTETTPECTSRTMILALTTWSANIKNTKTSTATFFLPDPTTTSTYPLACCINQALGAWYQGWYFGSVAPICGQGTSCPSHLLDFPSHPGFAPYSVVSISSSITTTLAAATAYPT